MLQSSAMKFRLILIAACVFVTPAAAGNKYGRQVRYAGVHPVAKGEGGSMCHIEAPHVHIYQPNKLEYRVHADNHVFVGDPVAYGWDGPKHAYKGHHPVQVDVVGGVGDPHTHYCYLDGPHYHSWEPPESPEFKVVGGAYFYVGAPPAAYLEARPAYVGINATYRPLAYTRPVVEVAPPSGWIGARVDVMGPGVVVAPRGHVVAPGVRIGAEVQVPMPSVAIDVHIGGPAVIVRERYHGKFKHQKMKHKKWKD